MQYNSGVKYPSIFEQSNEDAQATETPLSPAQAPAAEKTPKTSEKRAETKKADDKKDQPKPAKKEQKPEDKKKEDAPPPPAESDEKSPEIKRAELVERSQRLKELYEAKDTPRDPVLLARLLVAKNILALHEQLEHPELRNDGELDTAQLLEAFDYMGELAEKLEHPETDTTPEIEETCHTLTALAAQSLDQDTPVEQLIEKISAPEPTSASPTSAQPIQPVVTQPQKTNPTAALFALLLIARKKTKKAASSDHSDAPAGTDAPSVDSHPSARAASTDHHSAPPPPVPRENERKASSINRSERQNPPLPLPERSVPLAAGAIAAMRHEAPARPLSRPPIPPPAPASHEHLLSAIHNSAAPATAHQEAVRQAIEQQKTPEASRKLEHLPLVSLLSMAEKVPVGHGRRLRSAYEKGLIDQEGLIKVLKSRSRNQDFMQEFKRQVARRHNLIRSSPEFLTPASSRTPQDNNEEVPLSTLTETADPHSVDPDDIPTPASSHASTRDLLEDMKRQAASQTPSGWPQLLIVVGVILIVIVIAVFSFA